MVKKISSVRTSSLILLLLIGGLFGFVPQGHAQSAQVWSEPINLSMSGAGSNPSIVVDNNGVVHVLWIDKFEGYKYVESPDGKSWSSPISVNYPFSLKRVLPPLLLADPNGVIHIFWLDDKNGLSYAQAVGESLDTPSAWRGRTNLDSSVFDFDVNLDVQGRLHIGYAKNPAPVSGTAGMYYRRSINGGNTWTSPSLLYESPYLRSLTSENAHIRIAVSGKENVYAVWDEQSQKRIFMATSDDGGQSWNPSRELITPKADLGFKTPYHADVDVVQDKLLVTWQVGDPGVRCTPYSWSSSDGGQTWSEPTKILGELAGCPERSEFIAVDPAYSVVLFTLQGDLSISAWNGTGWSNSETQSGPSSIINPATFETVNLGCEQVQAFKNQLFVVGCDQGSGGDIWYMTRQLDALEKLFPLPSAWGGDATITTVKQDIASLSSVSDAANNAHVIWIQSSSSPTDRTNPQIEYARWNGHEWTKPASVITTLPGLPLNLTLQIDGQQRLLLSWVNQPTGELFFSWANAEKANIPLEWVPPIVVSAPSQLTTSPDMIVDGSGRIVIAYAISLNEERGIYITQSTDVGATWSTPVRVFDAVAADWQMVDQPKLTFTEDGKLHVLFTQYSLQGNQQAVSLSYSQSTDGGNTWAAPEVVSENSVDWSEILASKETLHRFWQEKNKSGVVTTYHQLSTDGGTTWNSPLILPNDTATISEPTISIDATGKIHVLQVLQTDTPTLQEWAWANDDWQVAETRKLALSKQSSQVKMASGITSEGNLYAVLQLQRVLDEGTETSLLNVSRSLALTEAAPPSQAFISTPVAAQAPTVIPDLQVTPTQLSPLANLQETQSPLRKNLVGLLLIGLVVSLTIILTIPRRTKKTGATK